MLLDHRALLHCAYVVAQKSRDPSTQNGALLVTDNGFVQVEGVNQFPYGVRETKERWQRPLKYKIIEHAERNACYAAASLGIKTEGLIMVACWATCTDCARAIIQCGIKLLITHKQAYDRSPDSWKGDIDLALEMLKEARVEVAWFDGKVDAPAVRHSGELWNP